MDYRSKDTVIQASYLYEKKCAAIRLIILLLIVNIANLLFISSATAQPNLPLTNGESLWEIAPEAYNGMSTISDAFEAFNTIYDAMKSIGEGKKPDIETLTDDDWKTLIEACSEATFDIRRAKLATDFNTGAYIIPAEQFKCENKAFIIPKLNGYKERISKAVVLGRRDIAKLDKSLEQAERMLQLIRECIKVYEKVLSLPLYKDIFQWDWFAMETAVKPAIAEYRNELKKHRDKYQKEVDAAGRHFNVLESNISLINECDKPKPEPTKPVFDHYSGTFGTRKFELKVKRLGSYYISEGYIRKHGNFGYSEWQLTSFIENKNTVTIYTTLYYADGKSDNERLQGTFSADKKRLNLKYLSPKYTNPVQLTLQ